MTEKQKPTYINEKNKKDSVTKVRTVIVQQNKKTKKQKQTRKCLKNQTISDLSSCLFASMD